MNHEIKAVFAQNKNNILAALRTAGVKKCTINYSGIGDSGQVDEPDFGADVLVEDVNVEQTHVTMDYDLSDVTETTIRNAYERLDKEKHGYGGFRKIYKVNKPKPVV